MANPTQSVQDDPMRAQGAIPHRFDEVHTEGPTNKYDETDDFSDPRGQESSDPELPGKDMVDLDSIAPDQYEPQTREGPHLFPSKPGIVE